jgi:hypothetical protein
MQVSHVLDSFRAAACPDDILACIAVLKNDPAGVLYRLTDAEPIASARK